MAYIPGTILIRKEPFEHDSTTDVDLTVYNRVRVVGKSAVTTTMTRGGEWEGEAGNEITISPIDFGGVVDRPLGELQRDYEVESVPDAQVATPQRTPVQEPLGPSPEEQFAAAAQNATSS